jgi:hypothetical protein
MEHVSGREAAPQEAVKQLDAGDAVDDGFVALTKGLLRAGISLLETPD